MVRSAFGYIWEHRIIIIFKSYIWVYLGTLAGAWPSIIAVSDSDSPPLMRSARGNRGPPQQTSTKRSLFAENPNCLKFGTFSSLRRCQILPQPCRHLVLIKHHRHIDHRHRWVAKRWISFQVVFATSILWCLNIVSLDRSLESKMAMWPWQWGCNPLIVRTLALAVSTI